MTRCYVCPGQVITANGKHACEGCGTSYELPPVEVVACLPDNCQRAGAGFSSLPTSLAGLSTTDPREHQRGSQRPKSRGEGGMPTGMAVNRALNCVAGTNTNPRPQQRADVAPGLGFTPRQAGRARHLFTTADITDWLGGIALFVAIGGGMFLAWAVQ